KQVLAIQVPNETVEQLLGLRKPQSSRRLARNADSRAAVGGCSAHRFSQSVELETPRLERQTRRFLGGATPAVVRDHHFQGRMVVAARAQKYARVLRA